MEFFIDIGITVLLRLISDRKIPKKFVAGLIKVRNELLLAFPLELDGQAAKGFKIV